MERPERAEPRSQSSSFCRPRRFDLDLDEADERFELVERVERVERRLPTVETEVTDMSSESWSEYGSSSEYRSEPPLEP